MCWKFSWDLIQVRKTRTLAGARDEAVLRFPITPRDSGWHPCEKPLSLLGYLIRKTTLLGAKIGVLNRLPASYFVSVSYMCWAYRRQGVMLGAGGEIEKWLY